MQVKARTGLDNDRAGTVQFDVRLATFAAEGAGFIAAVLMDGVCSLHGLSRRKILPMSPAPARTSSSWSPHLAGTDPAAEATRELG